jgi:phosphoribosylformylglycinamidine synthase I
MTSGKVAVMLFPGTNCENETKRALESAGMQADIVRWNNTKGLDKYAGYVLAGGWSYEDRVREGVIAAQDPVMNIIREQADAGKPVLGICNGAQILVETGMVPGIKQEVEMAIAPNINPKLSGYYCTWVYVKNNAERRRCAFTKFLDRNEVLPIPIAHAAGRFVTKDSGLMNRLVMNNQVVLKYCQPDGKDAEGFPHNPNGSVYNIAGICNPKGNVLAMMPHPERSNWARQLPYFEGRSFQSMDGPGPCRVIFKSMAAYMEESR